jgi:hypothetical protein
MLYLMRANVKFDADYAMCNFTDPRYSAMDAQQNFAGLRLEFSLQFADDAETMPKMELILP